MIDKQALRRLLIKAFDDSELRDLCFDLEIDYDILPGPSKNDKCRELIVYCEKRNRLEKLREYCREIRPDLSWFGPRNVRELTDERFDELLPNIDYSDIIEMFRTIFSMSSASLLVIQNGQLMGGEWCITKIRNCLVSHRGFLYPYQIGVDFGTRRDEFGLLRNLATHFQVEDDENAGKYGQGLVNKILESIKNPKDNTFQSGSIILIEVRCGKYNYLSNELFTGFIDHFWIPLSRELSNMEQKYAGIKLVSIIMFDHEFLLDDPARYCTFDHFHSEKMLELPLREWRQDEIADWLALDVGMSITKSAQIAEQIFAKYQGIPEATHDALRTQLFGEL